MSTTLVSRRDPGPRRWLARRSADLLLAFTAASVWIAVVLAGHLAPPSDGSVLIPRSAIGQAHHVRLEAPNEPYLPFKVVFEAREDIEIRWRQSNAQPPTWTVQGDDLVLTVHSQSLQNVELAMPVWLNSLEGRQIAVSTTPGLTLDSLSLVAGRIDEVKGKVTRLSVTTGHPECAVPPGGRPDPGNQYYGNVRIDSEGTQRLTVRAVSGAVRLSNLSSVASADVTVAPGVALEVDDAMQVKRLRLDTLTPDAAASIHWAAPNCKERKGS
ncbi:hypothetical protein [Hydrogenophaga sp. RWCD_12]|uniref:hypothetical protein n=1 Tax=Hydrogenophaga sp. RWCD_12 TaxID=3391190 RepID=UPI003984BF06